MAVSKTKELTDRIKALNPDAQLDGLSKDDLETTLKSLEDAQTASTQAESEQTKLKKDDMVVAPGHSLTTSRGIIGEGEVVKKDDLTEENFKAFVESGHIVKPKLDDNGNVVVDDKELPAQQVVNP